MATRPFYSVSATEFVRNFPRYKDEAIENGVIRVKSHNRIIGGYLSPQELEHFERLKRRERQVFRTNELPDDLVEDIEAAVYGKPAE